MIFTPSCRQCVCVGGNVAAGAGASGNSRGVPVFLGDVKIRISHPLETIIFAVRRSYPLPRKIPRKKAEYFGVSRSIQVKRP